MAKKKILTFIDWFLPGYKAGGPIRSLANIVESFKDDYEYFIVTRNTDLSEDHIPYEGIDPDRWLKMYSHNVYYISSESYSVGLIKKLIGERDYDLLYLNSMYSPKFTLVPLLLQLFYFNNLEILLAPRGMLGEGAMKAKTLKKQVFLAASKLTRLFSGVRWHATTIEEQEKIEEFFGPQDDIRIGECMTLPKVLDEETKAVKNPGELKLYYIGRMSQHKNLSFALEYFRDYPQEGKISLDIYGALEEEDYYEKCMTLIEQIGDKVAITYHGPVPYDELMPFIKKAYHFLLLPTKGESYSHAILDSWGNGCPVLISDKTLWHDLERRELGWNYGIDQHDLLEQQIKKAVAMDHTTYIKWAHGCVKFVNDELCKPEIINNNRKLFV